MLGGYTFEQVQCSILWPTPPARKGGRQGRELQHHLWARPSRRRCRRGAADREHVHIAVLVARAARRERRRRDLQLRTGTEVDVRTIFAYRLHFIPALARSGLNPSRAAPELDWRGGGRPPREFSVRGSQRGHGNRSAWRNRRRQPVRRLDLVGYSGWILATASPSTARSAARPHHFGLPGHGASLRDAVGQAVLPRRGRCAHDQCGFAQGSRVRVRAGFSA